MGCSRFLCLYSLPVRQAPREAESKKVSFSEHISLNGTIPTLAKAFLIFFIDAGAFGVI